MITTLSRKSRGRARTLCDSKNKGLVAGWVSGRDLKQGGNMDRSARNGTGNGAFVTVLRSKQNSGQQSRTAALPGPCPQGPHFPSTPSPYHESEAYQSQ